MRKSNRSAIQLIIFFSIFLMLCGLLYLKRPFRSRLSGFVTDLSGRTPEQKVNIDLAQQKIQNVVLQPGDTFSFNRKVGPYSAKRGFLSERSILRQQMVTTVGGGVCQVSSTLYNTARLAGLTIVERVAHSQPVQSVPPGMDATVAWGVADLKFLNPYDFPIKIKSQIVQDQLRIELWGEENTHAIR